MNLRDQRKKYYISVKKLILFWEGGGLKALQKLLFDPNSIIEKDSWVEKVKTLLEEKKFQSLDAEIALVANIFKYKKHDEKESSSGASNSTGRYSDKSKETNTNSIPGGSLDTGDTHD